MLGLALPAFGQSYATSFSEQKYDRAKTPATFHGGVEVDAPTGALSYTIPIGPGIGMRGVTYRPTLTGRWAPQVDYSSYLNPATSQVQYAATLTTSWATLYPGRLDLRIDTRGIRKLQTNFEIGGNVSGVVGGIVPVDANGAALPKVVGNGGILGAFGYNVSDSSLAVASAPWSVGITGVPDPQVPMLWMTGGGGLMIGLQDSTHPIMSAMAEGTTGAVGPTYYWPSLILVVQGDVAYEFVWNSQLLITDTHRGPNPGTTVDYSQLHGRFRLNRLLNRFGEQIAFTYGASSYTAAWLQNGATAGPSITVQNNSGTFKVSYAGLPSNNPSYTIGQTSVGSFTPSDDPWHSILPASVTQDQTQESVGFGYSYNQQLKDPLGNTINAPIISSVTFPNRSMTFDWAPYAYARNRNSYSDWAGYWANGMWTYTFGVKGITDTADGQSRTTVHTRVIPQLTNTDATSPFTWGLPWFSTDFYDVVTYSDGSSTLYRFATPTSGTDATGAVGSPTAPTADQVQTLLFLKHQVIEERHYAAGQSWSGDVGTPAESSSAYMRVRRSGWALNRVGNPDGLTVNGSIAYPTLTESWRNDEGTVLYKREQLSNWDRVKCGWLTSSSAFSLNGTPQITRLTQRDYSSDPSRWFMSRKLREQKTAQTDTTGNLAAAAVTPLTLPATLQAFDAELNTLQSAQVGDSGGPNVVTQFTYGPSGLSRALLQTVSLTGPYAQSGQVGIDAYGYTPGGDGKPAGVMSMIHQLGAPWSQAEAPTQAVDAYGRPTQQTDANGVSVTYSYDGAGRLFTISRPGEDTTTISYDDVTHRGVRVTRGSEISEYRYNGFGEPVLERRFDGTNWSNRMTGYDAMGRRIAETVWGAGQGDDTKWASPNLAVSTSTTTTTTTTKCTKIDLDTGDCMSWSTVTSTRTTTNPALYGTTQTGTQGGTTYAYDARGRLTKVTSPNLETVSTTYNGLTTQKTIQARLNGASAPTAQTTSFTKDVLGRLVQVVDAKGQLSTYKYDAADRVLEVRQTDPANGAQQLRSWVYDTLGQMVILDQPESGVTYYTSFTVTGKPQITVYGLPRGWRPASSLLDSMDSSALSVGGVRIVRTAYDALGRVQSVIADDGSVNQSFTYDAGGRSAFAYGKVTTDVDGGTSGVKRVYTYGGLNGRLSQLDTYVPWQSTPYSQTFDYTSAGLRKLATDPIGSVTTLFANPATNLPTGLTRTAGGVTTSALSSVAYDPVTWNPTNLAFGNGASTFVTYRANQVGLASLSHYEAGSGSAKMSWAYLYDESGHLLTDGEDTYQYDELGRLTQVVAERLDQTTNTGSTTQKVTQAFGYDAFGNQVSSFASGALPTGSNLNNFTFNATERAQMAATNQLPSTANGIPTGRQYDQLGNLTQIAQTTASGAPILYMTYDALGRVTRVQDTKRNITEDYLYNTDNLRTVVKVSQGITAPLALQVTKVNLYNDAHQLVAVAEQIPGSMLHWKSEMVYLGTKEVAEFDAMGMHVTHVDHLGSPRMVTNASGKLESAQKYLPFGETLDQIGSVSTRKGFTNHEQTDPSGLIYMQARFYAPQFHRFLSPDPARDQHFEETQSWNIFSYVQNMPVMKTDPTGLTVVNHNQTGMDTPAYGLPAEVMNPTDGANLSLQDLETAILDPSQNEQAKGEAVKADAKRTQTEPPEWVQSLMNFVAFQGWNTDSELRNSRLALIGPPEPLGTINDFGELQRPPNAADVLTKIAASWAGTPYEHLSPPRKGVGGDCSGIVESVYAEAGYPMRRGQVDGSGAVKLSESPDMVRRNGAPHRGDMLYWPLNLHGPFHVAIWVGDGQFQGKHYSDMIWTARKTGFGFALLPMSWFRPKDPPTKILHHKELD